jgi:HEAT repeat protein
MTEEFAQELKRIEQQARDWSADDNLRSLNNPTPDELRAFKAAWSTWDEGTRYSVANALAALTEQDISVSFEPLFEAMLDDDLAVVRALAISGLSEVVDMTLARRMLAIFQEDPAAEVRAEAATALGAFLFGPEEPSDEEFVRTVVDSLLEAINSDVDDSLVRQRALEAYAYSDDPYVDEVLRDAYESDDDEMRASAVFAMGRRFDEDWLPIVHQELRSDAEDMRLAAVAAASEIASSASVPHLLRVIGEDPDQDVRVAAVFALAEIQSPESERILQDLLDSDDPDIAEAADEALDIHSSAEDLDNLLLFDADLPDDDFRHNGGSHLHDEDEES